MLRGAVGRQVDEAGCAANDVDAAVGSVFAEGVGVAGLCIRVGVAVEVCLQAVREGLAGGAVLGVVTRGWAIYP